MAWNLFKKDKNKEEEGNILENGNLEKKVDAALKKAETDKRDAEKEIEKIKTWAAEAIIDTYAHAFPNGHLSYYREQYKEDAVEKYDTIQVENTDKVTPEQADKCKQIVTAYLNQISLRESKLELFDKLIAEYSETKTKLKQVNSKADRNDKFSSHTERLSSLDAHGEMLGDAMVDTMQLEELTREFELKTEYVNQLEKMNSDIETDTETVDNSLAMKAEVDKMLNEMKK